MVDTPEGTRKPNGVTPPRSRSDGNIQPGRTGGSTGGGKYETKRYNPADYASEGAGRGVSPSPGAGRITSGTMSSSKVEAASGPNPWHDSPSPMGKPLDPRQKRPGDAASFYGGTPPAFPAPPGMEHSAGAAGQYSMSGALAGGAGGATSYQQQLDGNSGNIHHATSAQYEHAGGSTVSMAGPAAYMSSSQVPTVGRERGLRAARVDTESALREYLDIQQRARLGASLEDKERVKRLASRALHEVKELRKEIGTLVKKKEGGRIGRFVVGGIVAGTIPIIKRFFHRPAKSSASKTEYAYSKSQSMVSRILTMVKNAGWTASIFVLVLAALYVFQAEVMIRVAKTVHKRLKRLVIKMEEGERLGRDGMVVMEDSDLKVLKGWRWRVLLWSK
ncbi:hypothetical protein MKZ38_007721 [Zalerion maritima]|uniref:Uncharacterized protein n=1 Tax=Zalerion maritima TaxID=339359 RepID=A0AAD5RI86_9PEZI|nr:hypothetical protein MKZ38_007721 [Zalerion maritima]